MTIQDKDFGDFRSNGQGTELLLNCQDANDMFPAYLDRDLDPDRLNALTEHVRSCLSCYESIFSQELDRFLARPVDEPQ